MYRFTLSLFAVFLVSLVSLSAQSPAPVAPPPAPAQLASPAPLTWGHENWSALPLAASGLNTSKYVALVLSKHDEANYTREIVRLQWRAADPVDIYILLPHNVTRPAAIVYLYDYRFDSERFRDDPWCTRATKDGVAAIGFTTALSLERTRNRPMKEWFVSELQEALGTTTHDVQMILNYIDSRGDIDSGRIGIFGQGAGGAVALLAADVDPRIQAIDLLNPWGDWPDWLKYSRQIPDEERPDYLTPEFLGRVKNLDPLLSIPRLTTRHLRIQQVLDDTVTPPQARDKIAAAVRAPTILARFDDTAAHAANWRKSGLSGWLIEQLTANQQPKP